MKLADYFETRKRDNGESFVTLRDDAPEWLQAALRDAHQDDLPNDWIFAECRAACEAIDDGSLTDDDIGQYADGRVDIYTPDRFQWARDMCMSTTFAVAEDQAKELGGESDSISDMIAKTQYFAIEYIAQIMLNAASAAEQDDDS